MLRSELKIYKYNSLRMIKCFIQSLSDGTSAIGGKLNGVQIHIKEIHPNALYAHICGSRNQLGMT